MSKNPALNANLRKGTEIRKAGFKTYMHSILNEKGEPYYAWAATKMYNDGLGAVKIRKQLTIDYPDIEPPSVAALSTFVKKYATVMVPQNTVDPRTRPDAMASMYMALGVLEGELTKAQKMAGDSGVPLPMIRGIAMNIIQAGKTIAEAEKSVGLPPINVTNVHGDVINHQENTTNVQQNTIIDPEKGKALLDKFAAFQQQVIDYQTQGAMNAASK